MPDTTPTEPPHNADTPDQKLVFCHEHGRPIDPNWLTKMFQRTAAEARLPVIPLHGLRHLSATLALRAGVPLKVTSERLGHSRISITADLYQDVLKGMDRDAASAIAATLLSPDRCSPFADGA